MPDRRVRSNHLWGRNVSTRVISNPLMTNAIVAFRGARISLASETSLSTFATRSAHSRAISDTFASSGCLWEVDGIPWASEFEGGDTIGLLVCFPFLKCLFIENDYYEGGWPVFDKAWFMVAVFGILPQLASIKLELSLLSETWPVSPSLGVERARWRADRAVRLRCHLICRKSQVHYLKTIFDMRS